MKWFLLPTLLFATVSLEHAGAGELVPKEQLWKSQMGRGTLVLKGPEGQVDLHDIEVELRESGGDLFLKLQFGTSGGRSKPGELIRKLSVRWTDFEHPRLVADIEQRSKTGKPKHAGTISLLRERFPLKITRLQLSRPSKHPVVPSRAEKKLEIEGVFELADPSPAGRNQNWKMDLKSWLEK